MDANTDTSSADEATPVAYKTSIRSKKNLLKVSRKINKTGREKLKRDRLNYLFLDLVKALDIKEPNNGKASILTEVARFLNGMLMHVSRLGNQNKTLTSESQYRRIMVEKEELDEDNSLLLSEVKKLREQIESKKLQPQQPDQNLPPQFQLAPQPAPLLSKDDFAFTVPDTTCRPCHPLSWSSRSARIIHVLALTS